MGRPLNIQYGIAQLHPDTDPQSIDSVLGSADEPPQLQFDEPLPKAVLEAAATALAKHPDVGFRAYGDRVDPSLSWLSGFEHLRELGIDLWNATSLEALGRFRDLRRLYLGGTASKLPSLSFLRELPNLEVLSVEGHDRDFEAVADVRTLRHLHLRVPRVKTLESLRGHPALEVFSMDYGGIRDLKPLAELPQLRAVELWQVRKLETEDLDPLGECRKLEALSLGALRNVRSLATLARSPRTTLRFLTLERMSGLGTLAGLASCHALEQLYMIESRPEDRRLDALLSAKRLRHLLVNDVYTSEQIASIKAGFRGETFWYRGEYLRGNGTGVEVEWRRPVQELLD